MRPRPPCLALNAIPVVPTPPQIIRHRAVSALVLTLLTTTSFAGGFTTKEELKNQEKQAELSKLQALVGKQFYFRSKDCIYHIAVTEENNSSSAKYSTDKPVKMTIKDYVGREYGYSYLVEFEDGVTGYIRDYEFSMSLIGQSMKGDGTEYCVTTYNPADQKKQKVFLGFALLLAAVFAHAEEVGITAKNAAITAALADSVTTKLVLQNGGFERNHLVTASTTGLVALAALKWGVVEAVDASSFSPEHKNAALVALSVSNPVAIAAGIATGYYLLNASYVETQRPPPSNRHNFKWTCAAGPLLF